jgi:eukaryotic-like serine/threonine-protein kinase
MMAEPSPIPVREGDLLAGKYRVEKVLGIGGMGIVVAARHEQLDQRVALKFVREEALGNEEAVERFLREARSAVKLKSEHAAKVLDVGTLESGAPYMVMEFLEGSDLGAVLAERGPLSIEEACDYVVQACEAVAEAHATGIVHRDIKPQNLFLALSVGGAPRIKVLDFGVAKSLVSSGGSGGLTQTRSMLGSPLYMSPEQMRSSRDVDARSDVWALGVVLFELLTRRWPYEAETMPELCLKVVTEPPMSLAELRPDAPPGLVEIVAQCLEREPDRRFANAAELSTALEPLVPAASRVTVERARLAIRTTARNPQAPAHPLATSPTLLAPEAPARTGPTPAAWDSRNAAAQGATKSRSPAVWIGVGFAAAAAVGIAAMLLRAPAESKSPVSVSTAAAAPPPPVTTPLPTMTTTAAEPPASSSAAATPTQSAPTASAAPKPTTVPGRMVPVGPTGPKATAKPKDDDIPSLR